MATLTVTQTTDFRPPPAETDIDALVFDDPNYDSVTATFERSQFSSRGISGSAAVTGGMALDHIRIFMTPAGNYSITLANWTFTNWGANDRITLIGASGTGGNTSSLTGSSVADLIVGGDGHDFVHGGDGNDTVRSVDGAGDSFYGEDGNDSLTGGSGIDLLDGGTGADTLTGGDQRDSYIIDSPLDVVIETGTDGLDLILASFSLSLQDYAGVEYLTLTVAGLTGTGTEADNGMSVTGGTLYGLGGNDALTGDNSTLYGGAGDDAYHLNAGGNSVVVEEAGPAGGTADSVVIHVQGGYTLPDNVENLRASGGGGTVFGNALDNIMSVTGFGSSPITFAGGDGNDTYVSVDRPMVIIEEAGAAAGTADGIVIKQQVVSLADYANIENAEIIQRGTGTITGTDADNVLKALLPGVVTLNGLGGNDTLISDAGKDSLSGGDGNDSLTSAGQRDTLDGGGGADTMTGGGDYDLYCVDATSDVVVEADGGGKDIVRASASFVLGAFVEDLELQGSGDLRGEGNGLGNKITGNVGANLLKGWAGNDTIDAWAGNDTVRGGDGRDFVDGKAGEDVLFGEAGNDLLTGGTGADKLNGGDGADTLDGGDNADTLIGGDGNDVYIYSPSDMIVEAASLAGGNDIVQSAQNVGSFSHAGIERLVLAGTADLNANGGALNDNIFGNTGANRLAGLAGDDSLTGGNGDDTLTGGDGHDSMNGGTGNDTYVAVLGGASGDVITEVAGGGTDTVQSAEDASLGGIYVENLLLTGTSGIGGQGNAFANQVTGNGAGNRLGGAAGNDTVNGLDGADWITGDDGNDVLDGGLGLDRVEGNGGNDTIGGGAADDLLIGGGGRDVFRFAEADAGHDVIADFDEAVDRFILAGGSFTGKSESGGNTTLTHDGGTIQVNGVTGLSIVEWNTLVLPQGAKAAAVSTSADGGYLTFAPDVGASLATPPTDLTFVITADFLSV